MVQELQPQTVPEEFFNLTQLAEVTLIAGKLSTTDINEIRNYINKSENCHESSNNSNNNNNKIEMDENIRVLSHYNEKNNSCYESTKKKWKNNWENFKDQEIHYENLNYTNRRNNNNTCSNNNNQITNENSPSSVSPKTYAFLSSSCSSVSSDCDDDSTKSLLSYSHKVFDRKKQRSFKQSSTESEYEFHFECQRPPYNIQHLKEDTSCDIEVLKASDGDGDGGGSDGDHSNGIKNEKYLTDGNSSENHDTSTDIKSDDHMCPECGKKYSTSKSATTVVSLLCVTHQHFL